MLEIILKEKALSSTGILQDWVEKYHGTLLAISHGLISKLYNGEYFKAADDFVSAVFQKLCGQSVDDLENIKDPLAYMIKMLKHLIIDETRSASFRTRENNRDHRPIEDLEEIPLQSPIENYSEMIEHLRVNMNMTLFTVLLLHIEGFENSEIAEILHINLSNVGVRLYRAKGIARRLLNH